MTDPRSRWILLAFCLVVVVLTIPVAGQDLPTTKPEEVGVCPEKVQELSTFMQSLVDQGQIAGGVTMMLWEQGKLDLDDPVSKYIPEFEKPQVLVSVEPLVIRPAKREITIRHLLTHTSGLGYPVTEKVGPIYRQNGIEWGLCTTDLTLARNIQILAGLPLAFEPGTEYLYGMSTDVLGRVVERASDTAFDRFVESNICKPLGMTDTFFRVPLEKKQRLAAAYVPGKDDIQNVPGESVMHHDLTFGIVRISSDYPYSQSHRLLSGGAGLCSTASDYMRFALMILNGGQLHGVRLLTDESVHMMTTNQVENRKEGGGIGFGFGIYTDTESSPLGLRSSYASSGFWSTHCRISPQGDWTVIAMSQLAWDFDLTPQWFAEYEKIAAEAIEDQTVELGKPMPWMEWYDSLAKPDWTPTPATIGLIWRILYPIILVTFGFVFVQALRRKVPWWVAVPFAINLVANLIFTPIQFALRNLPLASADILVVWATIIWMILVIWPYYRWIAVAQVPYLIWVSLATVLQLNITWMNWGRA